MYTTSAIVSSVMVALGIFAIFFVLLFLGLEILLIVARWKVFQKAGKQGWESIIPFYNKWVLVEISGLKWWFFFIVSAAGILTFLGLGGIIPFTGLVSLIGLFCCHYNLAIRFNKEPIGYAIGLTLLPVIFYPILAFESKNKYTKHNVSSYGPISEETIDNNMNRTSNSSFCKNCGAEVGDAKFCPKCGTKIR